MAKTKMYDNNKWFAMVIIDMFCDLLESKGMMIPSDDREGEESESSIFGTEYFELEDKITEYLDSVNPSKKEVR